MDRVEEIEAAIEDLPPEEFRRIVEWLHEREQRRWDEKMDSDSCEGKLDFLFDEAEDELAKGLIHEWPSPQ
jgi:hypothetical protein